MTKSEYEITLHKAYHRVIVLNDLISALDSNIFGSTLPHAIESYMIAGHKEDTAALLWMNDNYAMLSASFKMMEIVIGALDGLMEDITTRFNDWDINTDATT